MLFREKMLDFQLWMLLLAVFVSFSCIPASQGLDGEGGSLKTAVFLSPPFFLKPGSVVDKYYFDIPFPRGHIALKNFVGEVIDENGNPVPLHETYLHHWVVVRYYGEKGAIDDVHSSKFIMARNSGPCKNTLGQYFGLGSETRKTDTWVPDPYGIEVGNPIEIPDGYEERWMLNVHAIDTRDVKDRLGCTECKCSLYNVTENEFGQPLASGYVGGLHCCYDKTQCRVKEENMGDLRKLYLKYIVKWVDWDPSIVPVKIYILDVTDTGDHPSSSSAVQALSSCKVEYTVLPCDSTGKNKEDCVDVKKTNIILPRGGEIVYGVAHQHTGGTGSALYGEDGQLLCSSTPFYGKGTKAGDEEGYIVGMSTCYHKPGTVKVKSGELLTVVSNYSSTQMHTGVMGLFYILVAEQQPPQKTMLTESLTTVLAESWWIALIACGFVAIVAAAIYRRGHETESYEMVIDRA